MLFNNKEQLPDFIIMTEAKQHDINMAYEMPVQAKGIYVMDRGYLCYDFLEKLRKNKAFFVNQIRNIELLRGGRSAILNKSGRLSGETSACKVLR